MRRAVAILAHARKRAFSSLLNWENSVFSLEPAVVRAVRGRPVLLPDARPLAMKGSNAARTRAALEAVDVNLVGLSVQREVHGLFGVSPVNIIGQLYYHRFCHVCIMADRDRFRRIAVKKLLKR